MRLKRFSIFGLVIGVVIVSISVVLLFINKRGLDDDTSDSVLSVDDRTYTTDNVVDTKEVVIDDVESVESVVDLQEGGWIPYWGFDSGYDSLVSNVGVIDVVSPVLYSINGYGELQKNNVSEEDIQRLLSYCESNSVSVIPTIGSYSYENVNVLFSSTDSYTNNIDAIVNEVVEYGFDGVDLDYELIDSNLSSSYRDYLSLLGDRLHSVGKVLSVTVFAQWEDASYSDHVDTRIVQDYSFIGSVADVVRVMAYDYTSGSSSVAGPIGPTNWIREVLEYATSVVDKSKVVLGVHLYGYEWANGSASALTFSSLDGVVNNSNIEKDYIGDFGEVYAKYNCSGSICELYYIDKVGVNARRDIAKEFGIMGIVYWKLGGESDLLR